MNDPRTLQALQELHPTPRPVIHISHSSLSPRPASPRPPSRTQGGGSHATLPQGVVVLPDNGPTCSSRPRSALKQLLMGSWRSPSVSSASPLAISPIEYFLSPLHHAPIAPTPIGYDSAHRRSLGAQSHRNKSYARRRHRGYACLSCAVPTGERGSSRHRCHCPCYAPLCRIANVAAVLVDAHNAIHCMGWQSTLNLFADPSPFHQHAPRLFPTSPVGNQQQTVHRGTQAI